MSHLTLEQLIDSGHNFSTTIVSLASQPGTFGTTVHSAGYAELGLPFRYVALTCTDIEADIRRLRQCGAVGASVTMPFKRNVMPVLDRVHDEAADIGSVNTVVNRDGLLIGYNTDICGARMALAGLNETDMVVILGDGAMSRTFIYAIPETMPVLVLTRRDQTLDYDLPRATIVINATPMGMPGIPQPPHLLDQFPDCRRYIESVVNETDTVATALDRGLEVITGEEIAFEQAFRQFELYTGHEAPRNAMRRAIIS